GPPVAVGGANSEQLVVPAPFSNGAGTFVSEHRRKIASYVARLAYSGEGSTCTSAGPDPGRSERAPFDNFPPGLPGRMATLASHLPGGITLAARQLRIGWLRRTRLLFGWMARRPIPDDIVHRWTEPSLTIPAVRRDLEKYAATRQDRTALVRDTEALSAFAGHALVLWSPHNRVMPPAHGHRLAELIPHARYAEIEDAYVLSMLDRPAEVAAAIGSFLIDRRDPADS
ncbi:MAG: hypothetical protein SW127_02015, partial [Actinomycetota bacterium]|nr:hypothetical protein [Actinomycetota bacterium]